MSLNQIICFLWEVFVESKKIIEVIREEKTEKMKGLKEVNDELFVVEQEE